MVKRKAARTIYCAKKVGSRIGTKVSLRRRKAGLDPFFQCVEERLVDFLNGHAVAASVVVNGTNSSSKTEFFNFSWLTYFHEFWHGSLRFQEHNRYNEIGYLGLEESMACACADYMMRFTAKAKRLNTKRMGLGPKILPLFHEIVAASKNGGVSSEQEQSMVEIARKLSGARPSNWAAFLQAMHYYAAYSMCYRILADRGCYNGKKVFFSAVAAMEESNSTQPGLEMLMDADPDPEFDYSKLWVPAFNDGILSQRAVVNLTKPKECLWLLELVGKGLKKFQLKFIIQFLVNFIYFLQSLKRMDNLHVALILDGNRRWAVENQLPKLMGHHRGAKTLKKAVGWCVDLSIKEFTVYGFSTENFKRSEEEITSLFNIMRKYFKELLTSKEIHDNEIKVRFIGKLDLFPEDLQQIMREVEEKTEHYQKHVFNLCVAYGGHEEITQAVNKAIKLGDPVTEESFANLLYLNNNPDIIVRTGGAIRTSNFLPWQSAYSEWFFIEEHWPAFSKEKLEEIIQQFHERKRNFGK